MMQGIEWRKKKMNEIKQKLKEGKTLNSGEEQALLFWRNHKWLFKEE